MNIRGCELTLLLLMAFAVTQPSHADPGQAPPRDQSYQEALQNLNRGACTLDPALLNRARITFLTRFIHEFRGPTASEPDFMQCLAQFQVPYKNDSVSNGLPVTVAADPHFRWLG